MPLLAAILRGEPAGELDAAALEMAAIERPGLDPAPYLETLDQLASEIATRLGRGYDGPKFVRVANDYLFEEWGFRGNESEYYDPRNSCLDAVLDRRTGIPITLSVVYIEVARRLGQPVFGIGLPGHFIVQYNDGKYSTFADPFHGGKLLTEEDCRVLAREVGVDIAAEPSTLQPVSNRYILVRMLNNLRSSYFRSKNYRKAIQALDPLVEAFPSNAEYYKARGVARLQLREFRAAKADLEKYLKCSPEAEDKAEVTKQLEAIHRWLGRLN
ncbi:MAG TPA: transglutaminase-like domain-containing protein [Bryobacteraceae bacterium]|jgi:regulator of sirC expression with transglutaminase-like and TPR domain|nr:transglutaminase-like domain-containing protein [Bryobacteraceae bacterium]